MNNKCAYDKAMLADLVYSETVTALYGPKATRWTITDAQHSSPTVTAAYRAKLDADDVLLAVMRGEAN